jgi:hypothetical protein
MRLALAMAFKMLQVLANLPQIDYSHYRYRHHQSRAPLSPEQDVFNNFTRASQRNTAFLNGILKQALMF